MEITQEEVDRLSKEMTQDRKDHIDALAESLNNEEEIDGEFKIPCQALYTDEDDELISLCPDEDEEDAIN